MTGAEFRALRETAGLSVRQAAAALGVAPSTVYRYEHAGQRIPADVADALRTRGTTVHHLAARAALDPWFLGHALARVRGQRGWDDAALAAALGLDPERLPQLALCRRPAAGETATIERIAAYVGCDAGALAAMLAEAEAEAPAAGGAPVAWQA